MGLNSLRDISYMRVFLNHFNLDALNDVAETFRDCATHTETSIVVYTNEGVFHIRDNGVYARKVCDKDVFLVDQYYDHFQLIVDPSVYREHAVASVCGDAHVAIQTQTKYYQLSPSSSLRLVLKYICRDGSFSPADMYWETDKDVDVRDLFIKKELIEFLLALN